MLVKLLDGMHQAVVLAALLLDAPRKFAAHGFHGPAAEIFVDVACRQVELRLRQIEAQHAIAHQAGTSYQHRQNFLVSQAREVDMLQRILGAAGGNGYAHIARNQREHVRGPLHEFLHVADPGQRV